MWIDRSEMMERSKKTALKQNNCGDGGQTEDTTSNSRS